jgi:predicted amidohydrolase
MKSTNKAVKQINTAARKNGWDIVAASVSLASDGARAIVLVKRDRAQLGREYSTHEFAYGKFFWGHYDMSEQAARADYAARSGHKFTQAMGV